MQRTRVQCWAMILLVPWTSGGAQEPEAFVMRHAQLDVAVDYDAGQLNGAMTVTLENWTTHAADRVSFLLHRLMEASAVTDSAGAALSYVQDVLRVVDHPTRQVTQLLVRLPSAVPAGGRTTVRISYSGFLTPYTEVGWLYVRDHVDSAFTILRSDALAFPDLGGLNEAANRRLPREDFTYDVSVRVPARYVVAMGGTATRTPIERGSVTWRYTTARPSSVMNIAIAAYDTISKGGVRLFHFREDSIGARRVMARTQSALQTMTDWFGPLHTPLNLTIAEIPDGWGSQASLVGGIIQSAAAFRDSTRIGELYHELSHLWNADEAERPFVRWNEGLASFVEELLRERLDGWDGREAYEARLLPWLTRRIAADSMLRATPFAEYGSHRITDNSYGVGLVMFATLYELLGEKEFNAVIGGYYQRFWKGGTTRDFVAFAKRTATLDLTTFFDDWMFSTRWTDEVRSASSVGALAARYRRREDRERAQVEVTLGVANCTRWNCFVASRPPTAPH